MINQASAPEQSKALQSRAVQAYAERRGRLWKQIRADTPHYTDEEIEARLEQFGTYVSFLSDASALKSTLLLGLMT
jgi:hypothetical protein